MPVYCCLGRFRWIVDWHYWIFRPDHHLFDHFLFLGRVLHHLYLFFSLMMAWTTYFDQRLAPRGDNTETERIQRLKCPNVFFRLFVDGLVLPISSEALNE